MTTFNRRKTDPKTPEDVLNMIRRSFAASTPVLLSLSQQEMILDFAHDANAAFLRLCVSQVPEETPDA